MFRFLVQHFLYVYTSDGQISNQISYLNPKLTSRLESFVQISIPYFYQISEYYEFACQIKSQIFYRHVTLLQYERVLQRNRLLHAFSAC